MALSANLMFFFNFSNPSFHTDSHPCIRIGGPADCIGGPVANTRAANHANLDHGINILKWELGNFQSNDLEQVKVILNVQPNQPKRSVPPPQQRINLQHHQSATRKSRPETQALLW